MSRLLVALACLICAAPAAAGERYALIVAGASGGEKYAIQQKVWVTALGEALKGPLAFPDANIVTLAEDHGESASSTAANVRTLLADLKRRLTADDTLLLVLLGHGTFDGEDAKFNLVGPDLTAAEWKRLLDGVPGRLVIVNTTASSFPFLEELSQRGRVVITATDSAAQRFATVFPEYFVGALADPANDLDKNRRLSVWEIFAAASARVKQHYEQRGQLSTERPVLDDDGDRVGREAEAPGEDGALARALNLDPEPGTTNANAAVVALEAQRAALEARLEELKSRRPSMTDEDYQAELEPLLIQLARVSRQIRGS